MAIMHSFDGLGYLGDRVGFLTTLSMGNMGFSSSICSKGIVDWNSITTDKMKLMFECQGTTQVG